MIAQKRISLKLNRKGGKNENLQSVRIKSGFGSRPAFFPDPVAVKLLTYLSTEKIAGKEKYLPAYPHSTVGAKT